MDKYQIRNINIERIVNNNQQGVWSVLEELLDFELIDSLEFVHIFNKAIDLYKIIIYNYIIIIMVGQSVTLQSALNQLKLEATDNDNTVNYNTAGQTPASLLQHTIKKDYIILGVTPDEFIIKHGSAAFDFESISTKFAIICEVFEEQLGLQVKSKAVEFCSKMVYEVGPEACQIRKKDGDKT